MGPVFRRETFKDRADETGLLLLLFLNIQFVYVLFVMYYVFVLQTFIPLEMNMIH